jgi:hypothetical protein
MSWRHLTKKCIPTTVVAIMILLTGYCYYITTEDQKAKRTVDGFLNIIKSGTGDIYLYLDITKEGKTFVNVLDYKFLAIKQKQGPNYDGKYDYVLLYDVTITNRLGIKLFKKYAFFVSPYSIGKYGYGIVAYVEN